MKCPLQDPAREDRRACRNAHDLQYGGMHSRYLVAVLLRFHMLECLSSAAADVLRLHFTTQGRGMNCAPCLFLLPFWEQSVVGSSMLPW